MTMTRIAELVQRPDSLRWAGKDAGSNPAARRYQKGGASEMTPQIANLLDDLRKVGVTAFSELTVEEANHVAHALSHSLISLDAAMINCGQIDWMDRLTKRLAGYGSSV